MNNQRGLTLVELLAAISISVIIIGTATMLLSSVLRTFGDHSQHYQDDAQVKLTLNTLSNHLSESTQVVAYTHGNDKELRYDHYDTALSVVTYKSLYYSHASHKLTLHDFSKDGNIGNDTVDFLNAALTPSAQAGKYTNSIELSHIVTGITLETMNTSTSQRVPLTSTPFPPSTTVQTAATRMLYLSFVFDRSIVTVSGSKRSDPESHTIGVKMLADWTAK
jgi:prepilin-type N-terminal cleavage/methylation domain-containing protein